MSLFEWCLVALCACIALGMVLRRSDLVGESWSSTPRHRPAPMPPARSRVPSDRENSAEADRRPFDAKTYELVIALEKSPRSAADLSSP